MRHGEPGIVRRHRGDPGLVFYDRHRAPQGRHQLRTNQPEASQAQTRTREFYAARYSAGEVEGVEVIEDVRPIVLSSAYERQTLRHGVTGVHGHIPGGGSGPRQAESAGVPVATADPEIPGHRQREGDLSE